jgi:hypothetical protein
LANIGVVYWSLDQNTKALSYFEQALAIHRELGDQASIPADLLETIGIQSTFGAIGGGEKVPRKKTGHVEELFSAE